MKVLLEFPGDSNCVFIFYPRTCCICKPNFDIIGRATLQDWSLTLYGTSSPAAKNDPVPFRNPIIRNKSNATRPVVVQAGRKTNRGKAVSIVPTYTVGLVKRKKNKNSKNPNRNSQKSKQGRPATRSPLESSTMKTTSSAPDLSLNLRGDLTDPLAEARGRKMSSLFEQYPKIQRIYPAPLQANGTYWLTRRMHVLSDSFRPACFIWSPSLSLHVNYLCSGVHRSLHAVFALSEFYFVVEFIKSKSSAAVNLFLFSVNCLRVGSVLNFIFVCFTVLCCYLIYCCDLPVECNVVKRL